MSRFAALEAVDPPAYLLGENPPTGSSWASVGLWTPEGRPLGEGGESSAWVLVEDWKWLPENHRVTEMGHPHPEAPHARVSTIYLGLNHQYRDGPILIWETMIFSSDSPELDQEWMWRYSTRAAAMAGHQQVVDALAEVMDHPPQQEVVLPALREST